MIYAGAVTARRDTTVGEVAVRSAVDGRDSLKKTVKYPTKVIELEVSLCLTITIC